MNPLMNNKMTPQPRANNAQLMGQFMQNPVGALKQAGYNIPDGMNNPRQIVDYLINNGQLNRTRLGWLQNAAKMFKFGR